MSTLYTFGPAFGLPDPSPFVIKAEMLLKLARLDYRADTHGFSKASKGKLPYIVDDGETVADSTFIRWHIEKKYGTDFDAPLNEQERAEPTAVDATVFGFVAGILCPQFESAGRAAAERHHNLRRYVGRLAGRFYPELDDVAGCKAVA